MDDHFDASGRFPGNVEGFHRHSQSCGNPLGLDFSHMMHPQLGPGQQTPSDAAYESHDDLCVDRCMGVGLYNGSQQLNHRGGLHGRWGRESPFSRFDFPVSLNDLSMQFRAADFVPPALDPYQQWCGQDLGPCVPCTDEDCRSTADSCCDSECTMADKCTDVACADTEDACTDQTCPSRPTVSMHSSEVVSGAAALISINHNPDEPQHNFNLQQPGEASAYPPACHLSFDHRRDAVMGSLGFGLSDTPQQAYLLPSGFLPDPLSSITNHLLLAHGDAASPSCTKPCPLDDPQTYSYCHMPLYNDPPAAFPHFSHLGSEAQMNQGFVECGAEIHDPESFLAHFNSHHRPYFTTDTSSSFRPSTEQQHSRSIMASAEVMSPPATPLHTSDSGRSSGTPSPLTPLSNSMEIADPKQQASLRVRSISAASSADPSVELGVDEEHRCLWRDEGSATICGQIFADPEELFKHASETHIKPAQKGAQGFRCGWDDCPRSAPGAAGFPQRSKIERHMQTHIGHKPHICPTCNKGFSAKQALTQHMFIHSNEKPLVCNICHKAFRYPSALTMHQRVHSGLKPLKCPVCGKGFSESSNLSKHKRTHEVKGRFTCTAPGCDRNFHRQDQLRRHMKTHQKDGDSRQGGSSVAYTDSMFEQPPQS